MTTQNGHCEHCHEMCQVHEPDTPPQTSEHAGLHSGWLGGHCPACAERERIVKLMRSEAEREWASELEGSHYAGNALDMTADDIEHGKHLEDQ